ncbi:MAG: Bug family tripartite tricarboxylate transporter substrate binding protein [Alphaproteobacteria bacterium]
MLSLRTASLSLAVFATAAATALASSNVRADAVADFYKGKDITLIVSSSAGGGYDLYARLIARAMPKHVPGNPGIVVQNMPGAGGVTAANNLYNIAAKDGTAIGALQNTVPFEPILGNKAAQFDPLKFEWLGSPNTEIGLLLLWHTAKASTLDEAKKIETVVGTSGTASTPAFYARILNEVFGTKLKMVGGYPGQTEAFLAVERGELDGYPSTFWSSLKATKPEWIKEKKVKLLVQYGRKPHPELPNVPVARQVAASDADKTLLDVAMAPLEAGRPYLAPPNVPADRLAALRKALMDTFKDKQFLDDAAKANLEVDAEPKSGEAIAQLLTETYNAPEAVKARMLALYNAK